MSVEFTESFMRFQRRTPVSGGTEINNDLIAGGLDIVSYTSTNISPPAVVNNNYPKLEVAADPTYASRNALKYLSYNTGQNTKAVRCGIKFSQNITKFYAGFRFIGNRVNNTQTLDPLFFIGPASISKNTAASLVTILYASPLNVWEGLLRINCRTGLVETGVSNAYVTLPYVYVEGSSVYIEVFVDTVANQVRVWIDDLLIADTAFAAGVLAAAKAQYDLGVGFMMSEFQNTTTSSGGAQTVRDIYVLNADATVPNTRLGATTQVIGELPDTDVQADFVRPGGYDSNADVAALPVVQNPTIYLTGDTVGDEDRYTYSASAIAAQASIVHAIGVKATIANFAAASHEISAVVKSGTTTGAESVGTLAPASGFLNKAAYFELNPDTGAAWTPAEAQASEFGLRITS